MPVDKKQRRQYSQLVEASSIGMMFPIAIGLGYLWGMGMDKLFGTAPWLTYIFAAFGVIAAFINLFRVASASDGTSASTGSAEPGTSGDSSSGAAEGDDDADGR
jgi:ATP synthase protein I